DSANTAPSPGCEYVYPTGTWDSNTSTYAYGFNGAAMGGALSDQRTKSVTLTSPVRFYRVWLGSSAGAWTYPDQALLNGFPVIKGQDPTGASLSGIWVSQNGTHGLQIQLGRYMSMEP